MTDYEMPVLVWIAVFLFLLQLKSSRNINYKFGKKFLDNFKSIFSVLGINQYDLERIPDYGSVIYLLEKLSFEKLEIIRIEMIRRLIRQRVLEKYRLMDAHYMIAIDGTRTITISEIEFQSNPEKYKHCLRRKISEEDNGTIHYEYYYYVLEAKLVTNNGLALSVLTEFVENESQDVDKQDCELKAFYRLADKLKKYFPRTQFCLLFDGLYAGKPTFDLLDKHNWPYIINYKKDSMPSLYEKYQIMLTYNQDNKGTHRIDANTTQSFKWVNNIEHNKKIINILECVETEVLKGKTKTTTYTWICKKRITHANFKILSNKGGRCRWKIENQGFKAQKREGYELEHAYAKDANAIKCFYIVMQIAHIIIQLMIRGNLIKNIAKTFGSIKNFIDEFLIVFTRQLVDFAPIFEDLNDPFQIRLDSS